METLRVALEKLIKQCLQKNDSNTPDFILADYLQGCLESFDIAVRDIVGTIQCPGGLEKKAGE